MNRIATSSPNRSALKSGYDDSFADEKLRNNFSVVLKLDSKLKTAWVVLDSVNKVLYTETTSVILWNKPTFDDQKLRLLKLDKIVQEIYSSGLITTFKPMLVGLTSSSLSSFTESVYLQENSIFPEWNEIAIGINTLVLEISNSVIDEAEVASILSNNQKASSDHTIKTSSQTKKDDDYLSSNYVSNLFGEYFKWSRATMIRKCRLFLLRFLVLLGLLLSFSLFCFCVGHILGMFLGPFHLRGTSGITSTTKLPVIVHFNTDNIVKSDFTVVRQDTINAQNHNTVDFNQSATHVRSSVNLLNPHDNQREHHRRFGNNRKHHNTRIFQNADKVNGIKRESGSSGDDFMIQS